MSAGTESQRVFIASTATDLHAHRAKVEEALLRIDCLPVAMESFGALPDGPLSACREIVSSCDAVVLLVAHRYGWIPPQPNGEDTVRSITWLEADAARTSGLPVFAFLVDPTFGWTEAKEQDRLVEAAGDAAMAQEVERAVAGLRRFKEWIGAQDWTPDYFTTPDDLATKVTASLAKWRSRTAAGAGLARRHRATFRVIHPLQPASHFAGRALLLEELGTWCRDPSTADRVLALVAPGGTGKTAFLAELLARAVTALTTGVVWSFYESQNTESLLQEAIIALTGAEDSQPGGRLERLQRRLMDGRPCLFVLDGLERTQSEGNAYRAWGELDDHQLRLLLRSVTSGLGRARALVTSRFPLADLLPWKGRGFRSIALDNLDGPAAVALLRSWQVRGDDATLVSLAKRVGGHALSVSVLGSYLESFAGGAPERAPDLDLDDAATEDPLAARLARMLGHYATALPEQERDLLCRLAVFPRGIRAELLASLTSVRVPDHPLLADAPPDYRDQFLKSQAKKTLIAGSLAGLGTSRIERLLEKLVSRGLVFGYERHSDQGLAPSPDRRRSYTAHPFLRDYFRGLLGVPTTDIHEVVRATLGPTLQGRPEGLPEDPTLLDRLEELLEHTRLAGKVAEAVKIYRHAMGAYEHIGKHLGDFARGARILAGFSADGSLAQPVDDLSDPLRSWVLNEWALMSEHRGDLALAGRCYELASEIDRQVGMPVVRATGLFNAADLALTRGLLPRARDLATEAAEARRGVQRAECMQLRGAILHALGARADAELSFAQWQVLEELPASAADDATVWPDGFVRKPRDPSASPSPFPPLPPDPDVVLRRRWSAYEVRHLLAHGQRAAAQTAGESLLAACTGHRLLRDAARARALLARIALPERLEEARQHLDAVRNWTRRSGDVLMVVEGHVLAARLSLAGGDLADALLTAETALQMADVCGYGLLAIEALLLLSSARLASRDNSGALLHADEALSRCRRPECLFAWGEADALFRIALARRGLGEHDRARRDLGECIALQQQLGHPELDRSRRCLTLMDSLTADLHDFGVPH